MHIREKEVELVMLCTFKHLTTKKRSPIGKIFSRDREQHGLSEIIHVRVRVTFYATEN